MMNTAFRPPWAAQTTPTDQYNSQLQNAQDVGAYDPLLGTGIGKMLDAAGASNPGGIKMSMPGLKAAAGAPEPMGDIAQSIQGLRSAARRRSGQVNP